MNLSDRLKELRAEYGYTQEKVSTDLNINRATYAHYETGRREPDLETIKILAKYFNCSIDYLMGISNDRTLNRESNTNPEPKTLEDYIQQAESLMLYGEVLDENDRQAILTAIKVAYETAIKKKKQKEKDNK